MSVYDDLAETRVALITTKNTLAFAAATFESQGDEQTAAWMRSEIAWAEHVLAATQVPQAA